jgi:tRNA1(Val) A37 N6-methylase TrmN6
VVSGDLRDPAVLPADARFDLVTGTPPYFPLGTGTVSERAQRGPCRFEVRGGVEAYCAAAARWLAPEGRFVVCETRFAHGRVGAAAEACRLAVVSRCDVVPRAGKPVLFSLYALSHRDAAPPPRAPQSLLIRTDRGLWSAEFCRVRERMGLPPGTRV